MEKSTFIYTSFAFLYANNHSSARYQTQITRLWGQLMPRQSKSIILEWNFVWQQLIFEQQQQQSLWLFSNFYKTEKRITGWPEVFHPFSTPYLNKSLDDDLYFWIKMKFKMLISLKKIRIAIGHFFFQRNFSVVGGYNDIYTRILILCVLLNIDIVSCRSMFVLKLDIFAVFVFKLVKTDGYLTDLACIYVTFEIFLHDFC